MRPLPHNQSVRTPSFPCARTRYMPIARLILSMISAGTRNSRRAIRDVTRQTSRHGPGGNFDHPRRRSDDDVDEALSTAHSPPPPGLPSIYLPSPGGAMCRLPQGVVSHCTVYPCMSIVIPMQDPKGFRVYFNEDSSTSSSEIPQPTTASVKFITRLVLRPPVRI